MVLVPPARDGDIVSSLARLANVVFFIVVAAMLEASGLLGSLPA